MMNKALRNYPGVCVLAVLVVVAAVLPWRTPSATSVANDTPLTPRHFEQVIENREIQRTMWEDANTRLVEISDSLSSITAHLEKIHYELHRGAVANELEQATYEALMDLTYRVRALEGKE